MNDCPVFTRIEDVLTIPAEHLPLMVLSSNDTSFISWAIRARTNGTYNHFMWMTRPGYFATQDWWYREVAVTFYKNARLKFWHNPNWIQTQREVLIGRVQRELAKPKAETRYDLLAILGQLLGISSLQVPWTKICSEHAENLKLVDGAYDLRTPDPQDVNCWLKNQPRYACYGRYIPD